MGSHCEYAADVASFTCPADGYALLPGSVGGELFRCGAVSGNTPTGWYGNCVPAAAMCDTTNNCEDRADEARCSGDEAIIPCAWPSVRDVDGICKECTDKAVSRCLAGQIAPSLSQNSCVCMKCEIGWLGHLCDIQDSTIEPPTTAPTPSPTIAPTPLPLTPNPTRAPTPNPTQAPGLCKPWCSANPKPWEEKCVWRNCNKCFACSEINPTPPGICKPFCSINAKPWEKKCKWSNCGGCSSCFGMRRLRGSKRERALLPESTPRLRKSLNTYGQAFIQHSSQCSTNEVPFEEDDEDFEDDE